MRKLHSQKGTEYVYHGDAVVAIESGRGVRIWVIEPVSPEHVLAVAGALWEVWTSVRERVANDNLQCELYVPQRDEVPIALENVLSLMGQDLRAMGAELIVLDGGPPISRPEEAL